jgi:uncharacterized protein YpmS
MELQPLEQKKSNKWKWLIAILIICAAFWLLILLCVGILLFTTGDSAQQLPDNYEKNGYSYENVSEPYWLSYEDQITDFNVDKDYLEYHGIELGDEFYQEIMNTDPNALLQD